MIVGDVIPIGNSTESALLTVALVLDAMLSEVAMENTMLLATLAMMTLLTQDQGLYAMLSFKTSLCGLCSRGTW
jgi:hypothetical protein